MRIVDRSIQAWLIPAWLIPAFLTLALAACAPTTTAGTAVSSRPAIVVIENFSAPAHIVVLDPSFGFSLHRGAPGVPHARRAASVGRAAAFHLADAATQALRRVGFDALRANAPETDKTALVISGHFDDIDEGHRRHASSGPSRVSAEARLDYVVPGAAARRLLTLHLDSARLPRHGRRTADVNRDASRVGAAIADAVIDYARRQNWLPAGR